MNLADAALALLLGLGSGSALLVGAIIGVEVNLSRRTIAWVMAFGSGILISAIAFDIMAEAFATGGLAASAGGFFLGAIVFTAGTLMLNRRGARHRKRSRPVDQNHNGAAIALGTAIDGIPESIIIGLMLIDGRDIAIATVVAIAVSNIPEALSSSACMRSAGTSKAKIFALWTAIAVMSGFFAVVGYAGFAGFNTTNPELVGFVQAIAGGALLAMLADTMVPEAFADSHEAAGLITAAGFILGFTLSHGFA